MRGIALLVLWLASIGGAASAADCAPRLWPSHAHLHKLDRELHEALREAAVQFATVAPQPIATLSSAGIIDPDDPQRLATRAALADANRASVLALAYRVDGNIAGLVATRRLLTAWAQTHIPTGQPVDESKLDQFVWAYDLVRCELKPAERAGVETWLRTILEKKDRWTFGPSSSRNNQRTHQLKLQILIAAALGDTERLKRDTALARQHVELNIEPDTGATYDYRERDALHYHTYDLEAWGEIDLVTRCCTAPIDAAVQFLWHKIATGDVDRQFAASRLNIDRQRADAGHAYLSPRYDERRAARAAIVLTTGRCNAPGKFLADTATAGAPRPELLFFLIRRSVWNTSLGC